MIIMFGNAEVQREIDKLNSMSPEELRELEDYGLTYDDILDDIMNDCEMD